MWPRRNSARPPGYGYRRGSGPTPAYTPLSRGDPSIVNRSNTDRYRLAARLAVGRASIVYLALAADGTRLAVKTFPPGGPGRSSAPGGPGGEDARARLAAGVLAAAAVRGPRTAVVVDADPDAAIPWVATLLVPGPSLDSVIAQTGPLPAQSALWLAAGMARGLADVHRAGLVHRSVRPSNVLLGPDGPVLTDAGTSWLAISGAGDLDAGEDILALGCLAFFAATGRTLSGDCPAKGEHPPPETEDPDLSGCPDGLLPIVTACLRPPAQRPSAQAVLTMLEAAAGPVPGDWLPPAVAGRLADYQVLPRLPGASRRSGSWLPRLALMAKRRRH